MSPREDHRLCLQYRGAKPLKLTLGSIMQPTLHGHAWLWLPMVPWYEDDAPPIPLHVANHLLSSHIRVETRLASRRKISHGIVASVNVNARSIIIIRSAEMLRAASESFRRASRSRDHVSVDTSSPSPFTSIWAIVVLLYRLHEPSQ